ncbi:MULTISPECIES: glycosyltransferase [unclassified Okeania]|uniref:glycosyltransferase n=1 Tax=unclassified Okeania TaxID=2634635 RepID=UPI0013BCB6ED|nr:MULTISPECIES: glycosyltransferase [unclassified Okeania]NES77034.1 glycosyltransferase family 4 protein [Okeania sp. SIO1H4]NET18529.1 glycosyltransferase family 4 protein [Okeania sp. SIO1H5]NET94872.1 glycosyltransferase family 4 protein [Okeania sp. SIO1H2]
MHNAPWSKAVINSDNSKSKIVIFASGDLFKIGGVQRSYVFLTEHLVNAGYEVTLVGWKKSHGGELNTDLAYPIDDRVNLAFVRQDGTKKNFEDLCKFLKDLKPDLVLIVNSSQWSFFLASVCVITKVPFVQSIRGSSEYCLKYLWHSFPAINSVFLAASAGHVLMPSYKNIFPPSVQEKLEIIPSQIEPATTFGSPDKPNNAGRFTILYSGRFSFEKRLDLLINAFAIIKDDFPEWDLWLYGMGPLLEKLQALVKELNLENRVTFCQANNTDEMYQIYPQVHLKVLPSEQEGCPMALREAMAHAIPVIAYDECSGSNEIITHGEDGLLITASKDRILGLAEGMRYLMDQPQLRRIMGLKARDTAAKYHPDAINKKWESLLVSAIKGTGKASSTIRDKYREEHQRAEEILKKAANMARFQNCCIFDRDPGLFEKYENQYLTIYGHRLFDKLFYLQEYMDVKKSGEDPLLHYISVGWKLGYNPSAEFDTNAYLARYMKSNEEMCPLYHFYQEGRFEGAQPIAPKTDYYEKWLQRKPERPYTFEEDAAFEIIFFNQHFNQHKNL